MASGKKKIVSKKKTTKKKKVVPKKKKSFSGSALKKELSEINKELVETRKREAELTKRSSELTRKLPTVRVGQYTMRYEVDKYGNESIVVGCVSISKSHLFKAVFPFAAACFDVTITKNK